MSTGEHKKRFWPLLLPTPCKGINENLDPHKLRVYSHETLATSREDDEYDHGARILVALKDYVFNVTTLAEFLTNDGEFKSWAAKDISYTLTKCSNLPEDANVRGYSLLSETELDVLDKWLALFLERFEVVGRMEIDTSEV
ncbi:hypothetical protein B0H10DRAFT_2060953 [Mycena sp. CBHHK59/15]|nr:hypothetical protein B0H10DRAFT_2060953 [Mycena sp. CBHHK59/15]